MRNLAPTTQTNTMLSLREMIDRMFNDAFMMAPYGETAIPKVDLIENENNLVVKAEMPGFLPENIDAHVEGNSLVLRADTHQETEKDEGRYHLQERRQSSFYRTIPLPTEVDADKATAECNNGVLTLTLPKREGTHKRINITAKSGSRSK